MASSPNSRYFTILCFFFIFHLKSITSDSNLSFSLKNFGEASSFESLVALYGDAKVVNGGSSVQITAPSVSSAGRVIYKKPIKLSGGIPKKLVSFSTYISFSMLSDSKNGDGLAFVVLPYGYPVNLFDNGGQFGLLDEKKMKFLSVEFDTLMDDEYGDMNGNHVGVDVSSFVSVKVRNLSSVNLVLNGGEKLQAWIDYEAGSKRLEVRLSKFGEQRPLDPLLFEQIDLSKIWPENERVIVGLSSSNGNSSQTCNVYSWSFKLRQAPDWMHSQPLDPMVAKEKEETVTKAHNESPCVLKILGALILGIGCGALGTFIVLFVCTVFRNRRPIVPEEFAVKSVEEYDHKKLKVVLDKASANEKQ